jgi:hypothetical protein
MNWGPDCQLGVQIVTSGHMFQAMFDIFDTKSDTFLTPIYHQNTPTEQSRFGAHFGSQNRQVEGLIFNEKRHFSDPKLQSIKSAYTKHTPKIDKN